MLTLFLKVSYSLSELRYQSSFSEAVVDIALLSEAPNEISLRALSEGAKSCPQHRVVAHVGAGSVRGDFKSLLSAAAIAFCSMARWQREEGAEKQRSV